MLKGVVDGIDEQSHLRFVTIALRQGMHVATITEKGDESALQEQALQGVSWSCEIQAGGSAIEGVRGCEDRVMIGDPPQLRPAAQGAAEHVTKGSLCLAEFQMRFGTVDEEKAPCLQVNLQ